MRYGFTTGSCAAAAAKAAAFMLLTGQVKNEISIETPKGITYVPRIVDISRSEQEVRCAVEKDGGDDPDITNGALIYASVRYGSVRTELPDIRIEGGEGVGRVTKPGLDQPVGSAAINHVPREMIHREVMEVCALCDYQGSLEVLITVPEGRRLAEQTFNPRLGIVGGISILGTSGIVEPMSSQALLDTIRVELRQKRAEGNMIVAVSPGNYGLDYMRQTYGYDLDLSVKCSNFIGDTIDMAVEMGYQAMLLTGHIGKLVKVSGGIMNTHSREGDCRMELLAAAAIRAGVQQEIVRQILECVTTEEAIRILQENDCRDAAMENLITKIAFYLNKRSGSSMQVECILYANGFGELAKTKDAEKLLKEIRKNLSGISRQRIMS